VLALVAVLGLLAADPPAAAQGKLEVTVVTILASDRHDKVDPLLKCVAREVQKKDPTLRGFELRRMTKKALAVGARGTFRLVDQKEAEVVVQEGPDKANWVGLAVTAPGQGEITYSVVCGKYLPIMTGYKTKNNDRLLLAIMVKPCHKNKGK
jgi:hypothetical protein